jgi:cytochrome c-type biogenesis protein CcmH
MTRIWKCLTRGLVQLMLLALAGGVGAQEAAPTPAPASQEDAGRLYNPGAVQQRTPTTDLDNDEYIKELEKGLRCTCGCNLDIYTCRTTDFSCATSPALHREILALHNDGKNTEEIREDFVARYGAEVLMSPKPEGFNLAGYLVPGSVMVLAGVLLTAHLLRNRRQRVPVPVPEEGTGLGGPVSGLDASPEELERLRQELLREDV